MYTVAPWLYSNTWRSGSSRHRERPAVGRVRNQRRSFINQRWRHEVECKLQTVDRTLTEFLQAEGIHNHPIRRHRGGALELRFAKAPHFVLAEHSTGRVDSYDATVQLLSGFNVPLPVTGTVAFAATAPTILTRHNRMS